MECDIGRAAEQDDLDQALNYERIEAVAVETARQGGFRLVETLAERVAAACLALSGVRSVRVVVDKPGALSHARSVAVEVVRTRP